MMAPRFWQIRYLCITAVVLIAATFVFKSCLAGENQPIDLELLLEGFDGDSDDSPEVYLSSETTAESPSSQEQPVPSLFHTSGAHSQIIVYAPHQHTTVAGYEVGGITSLKSRLDLAVYAKLAEKWSAKISGWGYFDPVFTLRDHNNYSPQMRDSLENELELGETFVRGEFTNGMDITFGRQVVVWGKAHFFRVTDALNPLDNRDRGHNDLEFKHIPVLMTRFDTSVGLWSVTTAVTHEVRYNKTPVYGSDFYPYAYPEPPREDLSDNIKNSSVGISACRSYPGYDISFSIGSYLRELDLVGLRPETPNLQTSRVFKTGAAVEKAAGNWLIKGETAFLDGVDFYSVEESGMSRLDLLLGGEYAGFAKTRFSFEIVNRHLFQLDSNIAEQEDTPNKNEFVWALHGSRTLLRDKLELSFLSYVGGLDFKQGSAQILSCRYFINDSFTVSTGILLVQSGENYLMRNTGDNDRIYFKLKFSW